MEISRINYLREDVQDESISQDGLLEIQAEFDQIPQSELREARENAMASDMLDELEERVPPLERFIYEYVKNNFGKSEANNPSWSIGPLAEAIKKEFKL